MSLAYLDTIHYVQNLHRQLLDVVKTELEMAGVRDITNAQSLLLFRIGDRSMSVSELTHSGNYLGTNVSYNLKKLMQAGYVAQEKNEHDKRLVYVRLTDKGHEVQSLLKDVFRRHAEVMANKVLPSEDLENVNQALSKVGRFWGGGAFMTRSDSAVE